jgi:hypothetical protein
MFSHARRALLPHDADGELCSEASAAALQARRGAIAHRRLATGDPRHRGARGASRHAPAVSHYKSVNRGEGAHTYAARDPPTPVRRGAV